MSEPVEADKLFDPNGPDPSTSAPSQERSEPEITGVGTLLRLAVGGVSLALDAVQSAAKPRGDSTLPGSQERATAANGAPAEPEQAQVDPALRHILIGVAFEVGDQVDRHLASAVRHAQNATGPAAGWARQSRLTSPARGIYRKLAVRRAARLNRWRARGMVEEIHSRALLGTTVDRTVNHTLDYVVESPQVQGLVDELVATESLALSQRVFVEIRGRAVSADLYDAHLIHSVVRHPSPVIPPPPRRVAFAGDGEGRPVNLRGRTAGFVSRVTALITDIALISILVRAVGWLLDDVRLATGTQIYVPQLTDIVEGTSPIQLTALGGLLIGITYLLFFWTMGGQTPGKALMGLRVVTRAGGQLSFWRSLVRFVGYWLSSLLFAAGFLWASVDNHREALHDKLAGTSVIYDWDAQPDEGFLASRQSDSP